MPHCRICEKPISFPWISPCAPCLAVEPTAPRNWRGNEIASGRSRTLLVGASYRIFKSWKIAPTPKLGSWMRKLATDPTELEWLKGHADVLVPIPQDPRRSLDLGHWPAGTLAILLSDASRIPHRPLLAYHSAGKQAHRSLTQREQTPIAYPSLSTAREWIRSKGVNRSQLRWVLIDDVRTSGATLEGAARSLRLLGIQGQISAWTLGLRPRLGSAPPQGHSRL